MKITLAILIAFLAAPQISIQLILNQGQMNTPAVQLLAQTQGQLDKAEQYIDSVEDKLVEDQNTMNVLENQLNDANRQLADALARLRDCQTSCVHTPQPQPQMVAPPPPPMVRGGPPPPMMRGGPPPPPSKGLRAPKPTTFSTPRGNKPSQPSAVSDQPFSVSADALSAQLEMMKAKRARQNAEAVRREQDTAPQFIPSLRATAPRTFDRPPVQEQENAPPIAVPAWKRNLQGRALPTAPQQPGVDMGEMLNKKLRPSGHGRTAQPPPQAQPSVNWMEELAARRKAKNG